MFFIVRPQVGSLHKVSNIDARRRASSEYYRVLVIDEKLRFRTLLLTSHDLLKIEDRKSKNPEEILIPSILDKILLIFYKIFGKPRGTWV